MKHFVVEITLTTNEPDPGDTATFYFSTQSFVTKPTDTPPNKFVPGRLKNPGNLKFSLFSGNRVLGPVEPSYGEVVIENADAGIDEWSDYVAEGGTIICRYGTVGSDYPADYQTVYKAYTHNLSAGLSDIKLRMKDRLYLMKRPIVEDAFDGSGGLEGESSSIGKGKQWVSGDPYYIPVVSVIRSKLLYFVQSTNPGAFQTAFQVLEGGIPIIRGADYASAEDMLCNAPTRGQVRFWFGPTDSGPVYFRLGSVPKFDLRMTCHGTNADGDPFTIAGLAALCGIEDGAGDVEVGPVLIDDDTTYLELCEEVCAIKLAYCYMTREDEFVSGIFTGPAAEPLLTLDWTNSKNWQKNPVTDMAAAVWKMKVSCGQGFKSNLAAGASFTLQDQLSRSPWWETFSRSDDSILVSNPGATVASITSIVRGFDDESQKDDFEENYFALFGVKREFYECDVFFPEYDTDVNMLNLKLMDTIEVKIPRFGLNDGKNFLIITQDIDSNARKIKLGLWG